jgi:Zn-dependent protease with chaperone function
MALFVSLLGVFVFTAVAAGLVVRALPLRAYGRLSCRVAAALLFGPLLVAAGLCAALVMPGLTTTVCHCAAHGLHHLHFCSQHPEYADAALLPAAFVLVLWGSLALPRLWQLAGDVCRTRSWSDAIARSRALKCDGVHFHLVDAPGIAACTTGFLRPLIAVDQRLWRRLDDDQRRAVLHHEAAHKARLDPLTLVALRVCAAVCLIPTESALLTRWQRRAEVECDRHAATQLADPEPVASALLELERFRTPSMPPFHAAASGGSLAERVHALLDPEWRGTRANLRNDFAHSIVVAVVLAIAIVVPSGDELHHAAETLLGRLLHH